MKKRLVLLILFLSTTLFSFSQDVNLNILSPQTYEFVRYGNVPVSHFTGEANVQVPIYTYSDKDFQLPIFLGYNSSGFMPNKRENIVGLNWYLGNASGVITRKINGVADETAGGGTMGSQTEPQGFFYGIKNNRAFKALSKESLFNFSFPPGLLDNTVELNFDHCEMEPDDFNFSTPDGKSGKFFLENTGEVRTIGNKPYQVDLSAFAIQPANSHLVSVPSTIKIVTDDGYTYHFGGSEQFLEIVYQLQTAGQIQTANIVGWHLSKIEAPNGRSIIFEYENYVPLTSQTSANDPTHFLYSSYVHSNWMSSTIPLGTSPSSIPLATQTEAKEANKTVYLKKIIIDNETTITFFNSERQKKFYPNDPAPFNQKNLKLDSVTVTVSDNPKPIHRYHFNYEYLGGTYSRLFLKSFEEVGVTPHRFEYYETENLPDPVTYSVDYWGFWNGRPTTQVVPNFTIDPWTGELTSVSELREPDPAKLSTALLKRQYYPTGGYTEFIYEPHDYRKRRQRTAFVGTWPELVYVNSQKIAGGTRIKTIIDFDGTKETNKRTFKYVKTDVYPHVGPSSGILMNWPQNVYYVVTAGGTTVHVDVNNYNTNYYPGEAHMQYTDVSEFNASGGCVTYRFTSYEDHPDVKDYSLLNDESSEFDELLLMRPNDHSFERGRPIEITNYALREDGTGVEWYYPVSKKAITYTEKEDNPNAYIVGMQQVKFSDVTIQTYKKPFHPFLPKQERLITFSEQGSRLIESVTDFTYDVNGYLSTQLTRNSNGDKVMQKNRYVTDFISKADEALMISGTTPTSLYLSLSPAAKALVDLKRNNILTLPVEVVQFINDIPEKATLHFYKDFAGQNFSKHVYAHQVWTSIADMTNFAESSINKTGAWNFIKHTSYSNEPNVTIESVNGVGNPVELIDRGKNKKSFVWGYNNLLPVAQVEGAAAAHVFYTGFENNDGNETTFCRTGDKCRSGTYSKALTGLSAGSYMLTYWKKTSANSAWELITTTVTVPGTSYTINIPTSDRIDDVKLYPANVPLVFNTFTHNPQVGITSKTDSNNFTEYYSYDKLGRLKLITDVRGNILKSFDYRYQNN